MRQVLTERPDINALGFNSSTSASDSQRFLNARAEAHWTLRTLLEDGLIALPDDDFLGEELAQVRWLLTPSGHIKIEAKDDLKARIGRSPDRLDAVAMAFATQVVVVFEDTFDFSDYGAFVL